MATQYRPGPTRSDIYQNPYTGTPKAVKVGNSTQYYRPGPTSSSGTTPRQYSTPKTTKPSYNQQANTGASARAAKDPYARQQLNAQLARQQAAGAGEDSGMSFLDALMAMAGGGGGGGGYSGPSRAQIQAQAEPARARIEAMYKQYADMIAGREADIKNNYATAGQNLQGIYGGATENVNNAYNAARAAQTAQLQALGLTEMAPPTNTQQQAYATSILGRLGAAGMSENEAARVAAINNNLALRNAASAEGTRTLSGFDSALMNALNSVGSGGGGGGGGGGLSPSNILTAMGMDYRAQQDAADMAWKQQQAGQGKPSVDFNSLVNAGKSMGMSDADAIRYAQGAAQYQ